MTRDEVASLVADRLGKRYDLLTQIINEIKAAQTDEELREPLPWFLLKNTAMTFNARFIDVPVDFIRELADGHNEGSLVIFDDDGDEVDLCKDEFAFLKKSEKYKQLAKPEFYSLVGEQFFLVPEPDQAYSGKLYYYARDQVLTTDIENQWTKWVPNLLAGIAGQRMARFIRDPAAMKLFQGDEALARMKLDKMVASRQMANASSMTLGG